MSEIDHAAARRADHERALREELEGYERSGKKDRAEQVRAELARITGAPQGRRASAAESVAAPKRRTAKG